VGNSSIFAHRGTNYKIFPIMPLPLMILFIYDLHSCVGDNSLNGLGCR
jgi:hypothetical protein